MLLNCKEIMKTIYFFLFKQSFVVWLGEINLTFLKCRKKSAVNVIETLKYIKKKVYVFTFGLMSIVGSFKTYFQVIDMKTWYFNNNC